MSKVILGEEPKKAVYTHLLITMLFLMFFFIFVEIDFTFSQLQLPVPENEDELLVSFILVYFGKKLAANLFCSKATIKQRYQSVLT